MASPIREDLLLPPSLPTFVSTLLTTATARSTVTLELAKDTGPFDKPNKDGITSNGKVELKGLDTSESWQYRTSSTGPWLTGVGSSFVLGEGVYATGSIQVRTILADNQPSTEVFTYPSQITVDTTPPVALTLSLAQDTGSSASDFITNNGVVNVTGLEAGAHSHWAGAYTSHPPASLLWCNSPYACSGKSCLPLSKNFYVGKKAVYPSH